MTTSADELTINLADIEFEPPCGVTEHRQPCDRPADWWGLFAGHCATEPSDNVLCNEHRDHIVNGGPGTCTTCGSAVIIRDYLVRMERIKP